MTSVDSAANKRDEVEGILPVHLDYTCLYGAAQAVEENTLCSGDLRFSRLVALSQLVEAIVVHDRLQFELGSTPDWEPYRLALERTDLFRHLGGSQAPIRPFSQIDVDDASVIRAAESACDQTLAASPAHLRAVDYAVRFRSGTYDDIVGAVDSRNLLFERYAGIVNRHGTGDQNRKFAQALTHLKRARIGNLGLHVQMRTRLITELLIESNTANYLPHYSRLPLTTITNDPLYQLKAWTMDQIRERREQALKANSQRRRTDELAAVFSPVFLACLANASHPAEILEEACCMRSAPEAIAYRSECRRVYRESFSAKTPSRATGAIELFKNYIVSRIAGARPVLIPEDVKKETVIEIRPPLGEVLKYFGLSMAYRRTRAVVRKEGDATCLFVANVTRDAIGILHAETTINEVFGVPVRYDAPLMAALC